ncbi:MAG TPA: nuclear transport factor 2 family protein [Candidatus Binatia bacterium]|jgi:hypothetical protein|nr:nuclear transport factor 2 family protein [Candidatus Binatia bacterium]
MTPLTSDDRLAIGEVLATYCHCLDQGRWDELRALFVPDCRLDFGAVLGVFEGPDGLRRFTDLLAGLGLFMRHYTTNVVVRGDGERARAESYVLAITGPSDGRHTATGRYEDELVKRDGRWLLRSRRALLEA